MVNNIRKQLENEGIEPLLIDILGDRELNAVLQDNSSLDKVEIEIKILQNGQQLHSTRGLKFNTCPCSPPQHPGPCIHRLSPSGSPIC